MAAGWYPEAVKREIPPGDNDPRIIPALAILHVAVSRAPSLFGWFNGPSGGIESHFYIRKDGTVEQYRSVKREADANYRANSYRLHSVRFGAVSIETEGMGGGRWNRKQKQAIKALLLWLHTEHGIPLRKADMPFPARQNGGVGFHSQFAAWSPTAKSCPGRRRIRQFRRVLVPWMSRVTVCEHCPAHCPKDALDA